MSVGIGEEVLISVAGPAVKTRISAGSNPRSHLRRAYSDAHAPAPSSLRSAPPLPKMRAGTRRHDMSEICDLSAVELRRLIGSKSISPVELLASCLRRIEAVNPTLNAITATCIERAKDAANAPQQAGPPGGTPAPR